MKMLIITILLCLCALPSFGCEFGKTYMDTYGRPTASDYETRIQNPLFQDGEKQQDDAFYFRNGESDGCVLVNFSDEGIIEIFTGYNGCLNENPPPKGKEPYVLYKGHRWYPQYHGIIYVYKDGNEH